MKNKTFLILSCLFSLFVLVAGTREPAGKYTIGICYDTPRHEADRAVIRAILDTLDLNRINALPFDTGKGGERMLSRVDQLLKDRRVKGIILITRDQATAMEATTRCATGKKPVAVLGKGPEDLETFPAIVVEYQESRGYEKLVEEAVVIGSQKSQPAQPLIISPPDNGNGFYRLVDLFNSASYRSAAIWENTLVWKPEGAMQNDQEDLNLFLKENRSVNLIIVPGERVELLRFPLTGLGKWLTTEDPLHVTIACLDGSEEAFRLMEEGFVDIIGGRDVVREAESLVYPLLENIKSGKKQVSLRIPVPGRVINRHDMSEKETAAWNRNRPLVSLLQIKQDTGKE